MNEYRLQAFKYQFQKEAAGKRKNITLERLKSLGLIALSAPVGYVGMKYATRGLMKKLVGKRQFFKRHPRIRKAVEISAPVAGAGLAASAAWAGQRQWEAHRKRIRQLQKKQSKIMTKQSAKTIYTKAFREGYRAMRGAGVPREQAAKTILTALETHGPKIQKFVKANMPTEAELKQVVKRSEEK